MKFLLFYSSEEKKEKPFFIFMEIDANSSSVSLWGPKPAAASILSTIGHRFQRFRIINQICLCLEATCLSFRPIFADKKVWQEISTFQFDIFYCLSCDFLLHVFSPQFFLLSYSRPFSLIFFSAEALLFSSRFLSISLFSCSWFLSWLFTSFPTRIPFDCPFPPFQTCTHDLVQTS